MARQQQIRLAQDDKRLLDHAGAGHFGFDGDTLLHAERAERLIERGSVNVPGLEIGDAGLGQQSRHGRGQGFAHRT